MEVEGDEELLDLLLLLLDLDLDDFDFALDLDFDFDFDFDFDLAFLSFDDILKVVATPNLLSRLERKFTANKSRQFCRKQNGEKPTSQQSCF